MHLKIKILLNENFNSILVVEYNKNSTYSDIKQTISNHHNVPFQDIRLIGNFEMCQDDKIVDPTSTFYMTWGYGKFWNNHEDIFYNNEKECCVCFKKFSKKINSVVFPGCNHCVLCEGCYEKIIKTKICPICGISNNNNNKNFRK